MSSVGHWSAWLQQWCGKILEAGRVEVWELSQALGRMVCVHSALQWDRPFLAPLCTLLYLWTPSSTVPLPPFARAALVFYNNTDQLFLSLYFLLGCLRLNSPKIMSPVECSQDIKKSKLQRQSRFNKDHAFKSCISRLQTGIPKYLCTVHLVMFRLCWIFRTIKPKQYQEANPLTSLPSPHRRLKTL